MMKTMTDTAGVAALHGGSSAAQDRGRLRVSGRSGPSGLMLDGLRKRYGDHLALDGVSLDCRAGSLTSLLGPNGAGKTTLLEILVGLRKPDAGRAEILGAPFPDLPLERRRRVGIVLQQQSLPPLLRTDEYLSMVRTAYRSRDIPMHLVEAFSLEGAWKKRIGQLSGGQQRKLALVAALVGEPQVLILDEPTASLDPFSRLAFWQELRRLCDRGEGASAILLATHDMAEATELSSDVVILENGRVRETGTPDELIARNGAPPRLAVALREVETAEKLLAAHPQLAADVSLETGRDGTVHAVFDAGRLDALLASPLRPHLDLARLSQRRSTLEDVFVALLGPGLKETRP